MSAWPKRNRRLRTVNFVITSLAATCVLRAATATEEFYATGVGPQAYVDTIIRLLQLER